MGKVGIFLIASHSIKAKTEITEENDLKSLVHLKNTESLQTVWLLIMNLPCARYVSSIVLMF